MLDETVEPRRPWRGSPCPLLLTTSVWPVTITAH